MGASLITNRYAFHPEPLPAKAVIVSLKHCELCRVLFTTDADEVLNPGDYINLQRGRGRRTPILCERCKKQRMQMSYMLAEAQTMQEVVAAIRKQHATERELRAQIASMQRSSPLRDSAMEKARSRDAQAEGFASRRKARENWASWRLRLAQAFRESNELNGIEVARVMGYSLKYPRQAVSVARRAGLPIVVSRVEYHYGQGNPRTNFYTLSSNSELAPLGQPQDKETGKFMKEVVQ